MTDILCPTCKDDDCIDSYRVDSCTACGWSQYVPLESDRFQAKKEYDQIMCPYCERGFLNPKPSPAPEREKCGCGSMICINREQHSKPPDAVEEKIEEILSGFDLERVSYDKTKTELRELVKRVREGKCQCVCHQLKNPDGPFKEPHGCACVNP